MKCPQCGRWNRATLPKCFYCGAPLPRETPQDETALWQDEQRDLPKPSASVIYSVEEDGENTIPQPDARDSLAKEMQSFHTRRRRGEEQQRRIRQESVQGGLAPTTRSVRIETEPTRLFTDPEEEAPENTEPEGETRPGAIPAPQFRKVYDQYDDIEEPPAYQPLWSDDHRPRPRVRGMSPRSMRHVHMFGLRRFFPYLAVFLIAIAVIGAGYQFVVRPLMDRAATEDAP